MVIINAVASTMTLSLSKHKGVTLIEILLVLVIAASILVMIMSYTSQRTNQLRIDRTVMQMQQILNAGMAYYVNTGKWPDTLATLQPSYIPATFRNSWGGTYTVSQNTGNGVFIVTLDLSNLSKTTANDALLGLLAGQLPSGTADLAKRSVIAQVNIPGQNLNNARAINFAAIYSNGACVPAPKCPGRMVPQIIAVPVSVRGINDSLPAPTTPTAYPLTSFMAFARGDQTTPSNPSTQPLDCTVTKQPTTRVCNQTQADPPGTQYWRVCLGITTEKGYAYPDIYRTPTADANRHGLLLGSILAITRCAPPNESPMGTPFGVFTPNNMFP